MAQLQAWFQGLGGSPFPSGALAALGNGLISPAQQESWCQMIPFECQLDHQGAYVIGYHHLSLTAEEKENIEGWIKIWLAENGIEFIATAQGWFCRLLHFNQVVFQDEEELVGKNMGFHLPQGVDKGYWCRLLTEGQMLLAQSAINAHRKKEGKPLLSTFWFWGAGVLPTALRSSFTQVYSANDVIRGLARCANIDTQLLPNRFDPQFLISSYTLMAGPTAHSPFSLNPFQKENFLLFEMEKNWFEPFLQALLNKEIEKLILDFAQGKTFHLTRHHLNFFWRKIQPWEIFLQREKRVVA